MSIINSYNKKQLIVIFTIVLVLSFARSSVQLYSIIGLSYVLTLLLLVLNSNSPYIRVPRLRLYDHIPAAFLFIWGYGVLIGLYNGNNIQYIFMNFAGFLVYLFYYFLLLVKISKELIYKVIIYIGLFILTENIIVAILLFAFDVNIYYGHNQYVNIFFGNFLGGSSTGQIRIYSPSQLVAFPIFTLSLAYLLKKKLKINENIIFLKKYTLISLILSAFVLIFLSASKGYMLAAFMVFLSIGFLNSAKERFYFGKLVLLFLILILILNISGYINIATSIFSEVDIANMERYRQLHLLLEDINLFGNGLGATLPGSVRDIERPYGFELSYVNIVHKFGLISFFLFYYYLYTVVKIYKEFKRNDIQKKYIYMSLGLMCYLFPAIGNPILYSPQSVIMHVIALFLLRPECKIEKKKLAFAWQPIMVKDI